MARITNRDKIVNWLRDNAGIEDVTKYEDRIYREYNRPGTIIVNYFSIKNTPDWGKLLDLKWEDPVSLHGTYERDRWGGVRCFKDSFSIYRLTWDSKKEKGVH